MIKMKITNDLWRICSAASVKIARFGALTAFLSPESRFAALA
jgi:hypothetical protein